MKIIITAIALAAINSGFTQIEGTINGVGPAGGNTDLVSLAKCLNELSISNKPALNTDLKRLISLGSLPSIVDSQDG